MNEQYREYPERFHPSPSAGLEYPQVQLRMQQGLVNGSGEIRTKSVKQIVLGNLITPFNILNVVLASLIILVGSYKNLLFMGVIFFNTLIGTFQEIRAKKTIDKLSLIAAPRACVIRGGQTEEIPVGDVVLDDVLLLSAGGQICADASVLDGECEVNESLLTGESDPVVKRQGDTLLSGSFVVSGSCCAQVDRVGADNYASQISNSAKYLKKPNSEIMKWINRIIKWIGFALIPIGILLFYKQLFISGQPFDRAIVSTVAALIGMIPEGLVLLTSVVLAVSVIRLSRHKTLVQELYCIETLARVDTLCLDKTGTITEGTMQLDEVVPLEKASVDISEGIAAMVGALQDNNPTFAALRESFPNSPSWTCTGVVPFSSARKWSGASFEGKGSYVIGAAEFVLRDQFDLVREKVEQYSADGQRVLLLAHSGEPFGGKELPQNLVPQALILLSDKIREQAPQTLEYFADQGVDLKVISGDNAITVSNIARRAGLKSADRYIDASTLQSEEELQEAAEKYTVFGRVTPQQKLSLVKALKAKGRTVAMTGDGVNDVLALKEADCSVAMASGSDAARTVSQLVLLDSNFASMPMVVREGRRAINNLQRSASLFLVKAFFSAVIAVFFIFVNCDYPFQPIQFTLINTFTIGIPSFILALEPNKERIRGSFMANIVKKSLPGSVTMILNIFLLVPISLYMGFSTDQLATMGIILTGMTGLLILLRVSSPLNLLRGVLFYAMVTGFVGAMILLPGLFSLVPVSAPMLLVLLPMSAFTICVMTVMFHLVDHILMRRVEG